MDIDPSIEYYKAYDKTIGQIRHRLATMGDLKQDSKSNVYDEELMAGVINFQKKRIQSQQNFSIWQVQRMNIPIKKYISNDYGKYGALSMD
jgi:hypothetical protein